MPNGGGWAVRTAPWIGSGIVLEAGGQLLLALIIAGGLKGFGGPA